MTPDDFTESIVLKRLEACKKLLVPKGKEYSRDNDRLHNFRTAGRIDNETPEKALWGMWKKHLVSIKDIIDDIDRGLPLPTPEQMAEKFNDNICYTMLLEGLLEDRREMQKTNQILGIIPKRRKEDAKS